jgi:hypothetical protein
VTALLDACVGGRYRRLQRSSAVERERAAACGSVREQQEGTKRTARQRQRSGRGQFGSGNQSTQQTKRKKKRCCWCCSPSPGHDMRLGLRAGHGSNETLSLLQVHRHHHLDEQVFWLHLATRWAATPHVYPLPACSRLQTCLTGGSPQAVCFTTALAIGLAVCIAT